MMENMIGEFARTMQDDRHALAAKHARAAELARPDRRDIVGGQMRAGRAAIAKALIALAARLAPPMPEGEPQIDTATQPLS